MPRADLESQLPQSVVSSRSPSEVLQQLTVASVTGGGGTAGGSSGANISGVTQGSLQNVSDGLSSLTSRLAVLHPLSNRRLVQRRTIRRHWGRIPRPKGAGVRSAGQ